MCPGPVRHNPLKEVELGGQEEGRSLGALMMDTGIISSDDEIDYSIKPEFYDPDLDDKDELWVHNQRKGQSSDAVLSCPACFTTLSLDCQSHIRAGDGCSNIAVAFDSKHEKYVTQYRAMSVLNCKVKTDQILRQERRKPRKSKGCMASGKSGEDQENSEVFRPVCCSVCSTEVGVLDADEVCHFFNVIPSES